MRMRDSMMAAVAILAMSASGAGAQGIPVIDKTAILHAAAKAEQAVQWLRQFDPALAEPERRAA